MRELSDATKKTAAPPECETRVHTDLDGASSLPISRLTELSPTTSSGTSILPNCVYWTMRSHVFGTEAALRGTPGSRGFRSSKRQRGALATWTHAPRLLPSRPVLRMGLLVPSSLQLSDLLCIILAYTSLAETIMESGAFPSFGYGWRTIPEMTYTHSDPPPFGLFSSYRHDGHSSPTLQQGRRTQSGPPPPSTDGRVGPKDSFSPLSARR